MLRSLLATFVVTLPIVLFAQSTVPVPWLTYENGKYVNSDAGFFSGNTVYVKLVPNDLEGSSLIIRSGRPWSIFVNGKLAGEGNGVRQFRLDSLNLIYATGELLVAVYQPGLNTRDMKILLTKKEPQVRSKLPPAKPSTYFRDFVILGGLIIIIIFLIVSRLNPKLASDYFSVDRIISVREADDAQSNARLTSSNNFQFYILSSLLLAFYLIVISNHLPAGYALPLYFQADTFALLFGQWIKLSLVILIIFFGKIVIVYSLTRLFGMKGLARVHFFNWMRLLLIVVGAASVIVFIYFILRGQSETFFEIFLSLIVVTLVGWVFLIFMKLNGKTEHSVFHLFSYICATEIIPLLVTVKVLFQ